MMSKVKLGALALALAVIPGAALADSSCNALFARARAAGRPSPYGNYVSVLWTTNYFAPASSVRFTGTTEINLRTQPSGDMTGGGNRRILAWVGYRVLPRRGDAVSLRVRADGKIMFNDVYGPYDPVCFGDRFMRVESGDSIEDFSFQEIVYHP